ncbi:MAG TPA: PqqD family protein [Terracidiphilus sp.]
MATWPGRTAELGGVDPEHQNQSGFSFPVHVRLSHSPDGAVVLDILNGQMFRLNLVGSRILQLLKQDIAECEIAERLAHEFEIDRSRAEADLREFIQTLDEHHLLTMRTRTFSF